MNRYWEQEKPIEAVTERNKLRWFPKAERLQVALPDWLDAEGIVHPGRTVTLNVEALREAEPGDLARAKAIFTEVLSSLDA